jgi:kynurenine formamidase
MTITIELATEKYQVNIAEPLSLSIPVEFLSNNDSESALQPNHFSANLASRTPMKVAGFIGDTLQGGSCNVNELSINPHCNGTHTETLAHICDINHAFTKTIADINPPPLMPCVLVSIEPMAMSDINENYTPTLAEADLLITHAALLKTLGNYSNEQLQSLVIRTLPNHKTKCSQAYNQSNQPPFFTREAILYLNERGIEHLLVDIPSIDRLHDEGLLTCHHLFWQVDEGTHQGNQNSLVNKTITEMAFIDNHINDGFYFLNLQIPNFINDAAPSKPMLYACKSIAVVK